ncbi:NAD(P)-dependent oxidoreductase [Magnetospirillum sp. 64-120]|uniref:NAD-dependent epimerase/dehydratase family protein n=1 Tax=Magnetospirillum sp. 64-120 TaxID=1895778 RepID=UPI00092C0760|nr:NAD(P)-dependent oxidoreductase [Magnetospirillum sp. 64-120]OJX68172.1 MAG: NAD-dependent dehydratase [Magnetospirillum sp. 64-120]
MSPRKFLVTGGTGFLGAALVKHLVAQGHHVRVLDDNSRGRDRRLTDIAGRFEMVGGDIRDADAVRDAMRGMDCCCHLAYVNGTEFFYSKPELVLDVAVRGMLNVLDACRAENVRDLVLASSSEVYQTPPMVPTPETVPCSVPDPLNPRYSYGGGKLACELMAINWGRTGFDRVVIFRPHNVYGPDMGWEHVAPQLALRLKQMADAQPEGVITFPIQGDGSETRAFVHIDDFTRALGLVIDKGEHLGIYHLGNDEEVSIADFARQAAQALGREIILAPGPLMPGGTPRRCPDISKIKALGFVPQIPLAQGLPPVVQWYAENAHLKG